MARQKKAEELEELLLQKACLELMRETRNMTEGVKRVQFNKFYPEKYKINAELLKDMGTKVDRRPQEVKEASGSKKAKEPFAT